ncbi:MAG: ROK family protein [Anaerolineaceae bacterium]|nr:ROK family protein [Anaerolineaceae bacterium]
MAIIGIDIGGSGIKGAIVDPKTGKLLSDRVRIPTPERPKPKKIASVIYKILTKLNYEGLIGVGFPGVVKNGITLSAANIHDDWIGCNAAELIKDVTGQNTYILNDADAAGLAEMRFGMGKLHSKGLVLFLTIGTGIGSAFFLNGKLIPNSELGHLEVNGKEAEARASDAIRQIKELTWREWAGRFSDVLKTYEKLFNPDLFILGGGISSRFNKYSKYLDINTETVPARLENLAGIIGAAIAASENLKK